MRKNERHLVKRGGSWCRVSIQWVGKVGCRYKEWGNMRYFENLIVVSSSIHCNILYGIVEWFPFAYECRHGWPNHVKTLCIFVWIVLSLCFELTLFALKLLLAQQFSSLVSTSIFKQIISSQGNQGHAYMMELYKGKKLSL